MITRKPPPYLLKIPEEFLGGIPGNNYLFHYLSKFLVNSKEKSARTVLHHHPKCSRCSPQHLSFEWNVWNALHLRSGTPPCTQLMHASISCSPTLKQQNQSCAVKCQQVEQGYIHEELLAEQVQHLL